MSRSTELHKFIETFQFLILLKQFAYLQSKEI